MPIPPRYVDHRIMAVLLDIADERERQNEKWRRVPGEWKDDTGDKLAVLIEEVGEVGRALWDRESQARLREELIQVAATAAAWAETLDPEET